jgi:hypothetical protein
VRREVLAAEKFLAAKHAKSLGAASALSDNLFGLISNGEISIFTSQQLWRPLHN